MRFNSVNKCSIVILAVFICYSFHYFRQLRESIYLQNEVEELIGNLRKIPSGTLNIGCNADEENCHSIEMPKVSVSIDSFYMMDAEVTFELWDACVKYSGCNYSPSDDFVGRGSFPVVNVSYEDITRQFIPWLNETLSASYRLPTEAEWEYAAKAGSHSRKYSWGDTIDCKKARYQVGSEGDTCNQAIFGAVKIKSFEANNYGLFDMHGNVDEWMEDCINFDYREIPANGKPFITPDCSARMIRGGSWVNQSDSLRLSRRDWHTVNERVFRTGFRLVSSNN